jgi:hypothetical protein
MGGLSLLDALDYLVLLVELQPARAPSAAVRWHGRLELETQLLTLRDSFAALAILRQLPQDPENATGGAPQTVAPCTPDGDQADRVRPLGRGHF